MMGYTHVAVGAAGAVAFAMICGDCTPGIYVAASVAGALGGAAIDIDAHDQHSDPKVTDAGRTRLATLGLIGTSAVLDFMFGTGFVSSIISQGSVSLIGIVLFAILLLIGYKSPHRTFSHSLLFIILTSICVGFISVDAFLFYIIGAIWHLLLDMLNNPFQGHGVWLLYPIKTGKGVALGICKAAKKANKVFYFIGIILFVITSVLFLGLTEVAPGMFVIIGIIIYVVIAMHFVRVKSEKEQRHIMHMRGEL